jgi:hypothetical protein
MEERFPLKRGWRGVFSPWRKKRGGYRGSAGEGFIPYMTIFFAIGEGIGKLLKLL